MRYQNAIQDKLYKGVNTVKKEMILHSINDIFALPIDVASLMALPQPIPFVMPFKCRISCRVK